MAQTAADLTAAVELLPTSTTCSVEVTRPLDFAQVESPATAAQSGSLTIHPTATEAVAVRTFHHVIPHGEASAGAASVRGFGVTAFEVAVAPAFQASVLAGPAHALEFAGRWAQSTAPQGPFEAIHGASVSVPGPGTGRASTHHFRFGGTISRIPPHQTAEEYAHAFAVTITCV